MSSCLSNFDFNNIFAEHWYYHLAVSVFNCADFVFSIIMLIEMSEFDNSAWFWLELIVMVFSRFICSIMPFCYYTSTTPRSESSALCYRLYSFVLLFFFSPLHCLYHAGFQNEYLLDLLHLRERKNYHDINCVNYNKSPFQDWVNTSVKIHIFHSYPHCLTQAMPQCILYYSFILYYDIKYDHYPLIFFSFFINLFAILITSPIWSSRLYYSLSIGRDHYHLWSFIFNILSTLLDMLGILYILAYLIQLSYDNFFISITKTVFNPSYDSPNDPPVLLLYSLWYYEFMFVSCTAIICGLFIGFVTQSYILWDIFKRMDSFSCQEVCGGCLTTAYSILVAPIASIQIILWLINAALTLHIYCLSWITICIEKTVRRFGKCSQSTFFGDMISWIKLYENKNDLIIRLSCCNYHLQPELKQIIEKGIIYKYYENIINIDLGFRDIRIHSHLTDFSWFQFINNWFSNLTSMPEVISICLRICVLVFGIPYIASRIVLLLLPLLGFVTLHYNDWGNFITVLSFIYCLLLLIVLYVIDKTLWHLWIMMHIAPGKIKINSTGLHNTCMPKNDTLYAIKISYENIKDTIQYKHELITLFCQHSIIPLKIIYVIIRYLPNNTVYVDYPKAGTIDNLEKPLLESVDTMMFIGTV